MALLLSCRINFWMSAIGTKRTFRYAPSKCPLSGVKRTCLDGPRGMYRFQGKSGHRTRSSEEPFDVAHRHFAASVTTPGEALGEGIDLIVVATGKSEQFSDEFFEPTGALGKSN